jgi:hypothetical protein
MLGTIAALVCVAICHLVFMSPTIVIRRRVEISPTLSVSSFLFEECLDLFQLAEAVLKFSGQARVCLSQNFFNIAVSCFGSYQVGQIANGGFSNVIFSLANSCIFYKVA